MIEPSQMGDYVAPPSCFPLPFFLPIPHSLYLSIREGAPPHKKATFVTGRRVDIQQSKNFFRSLFLKVLE